uniref:Glutathione S-transferase C-terminal domain-containing protein n=1 Tax=mine drainage metagenome TaxID=410659 RepID=E6PQM5_9ZZZZ
MGDGRFLCGERFTAADIWLYVWLDFGNEVGQPFDRRLPRIGPWFERVQARRSRHSSGPPHENRAASPPTRMAPHRRRRR